MTDTLLLPAAAMVIFMSAAIYGFGFLHAEISHWRSFWKTIPVGLMAVSAGVFGAPWLLVLAITLGTIGDFFLSRDENRFTLGLVAFLLAHLAYIWVFWQHIDLANFGWGQAGMLAYAAGFGAYIWPRAGAHRLPVLAYIAVITVMVGTALMLPLTYMLVIVGSISFAYSDSLLALEMFVVKNPEHRRSLGKMVWVSYILAQGFIIMGLLSQVN